MGVPVGINQIKRPGRIYTHYLLPLTIMSLRGALRRKRRSNLCAMHLHRCRRRDCFAMLAMTSFLSLVCRESGCCSRSSVSLATLSGTIFMYRNYFQNKTALVTGGGSGIGRAICHELDVAGAIVFCADIDLAKAEATAAGAKAGNPGAKYLELTRQEQ